MKRIIMMVATLLSVAFFQWAADAQVVRDLLDQSGKSESEQELLIEATLKLVNAVGAGDGQDSGEHGKALGREKQLERALEQLAKGLHGSSSGIAKGDFNGDG